MEDSTAEEKNTKNHPPTVITVDTGVKKEDEEGSHEERPSTNSETETRTPKHANKSLVASNKTVVDESTSQKGSGTTGKAESHENRLQKAGAAHPQSQSFFAPRPYEGSMGGPTGAFQPHDRLTHQHNQLMAMQVSPGSGRYYGNYAQGPAPGQYQQYDQRPHEYGHGPHPQYGQHMYPPQQYPGSYQHRQGPPPGWGPPVSYQNRPPPNYPGHHPGMMQGYHGGPPNSGNTFSRAVSSSFDRSVKSRDSGDKVEHRPPMEEQHHAMAPPPPANDERSVSEDGSWRQLNQIQSVDEEEIRKRLAKRASPTNRQDAGLKHPNSNSSSLTNSPTEEVEAAGAKKETLPEPPKMTNSLDSLSSVASEQAPLATKKEDAPAIKEEKPLSPADSAAASLDLMKCGSGSSNLLLPSHQRSLSQFSFEGAGSKRTIDEDRGDAEDSANSKESRKAPSEEGRPAKRNRASSDAHDKKGSPLSIACSPQTAPGTKDDNKSYSYPPTSKDSFYDKPPMFSYSIDSAPAMPREEARGSEPAYPSLPARSHSSASSTIPPMPPLGEPGHDRHPSVTQMPSWEIQGQDSFGGASTANPLVGTFSFTQEYPVLSRNNSMLSHHMEPSMPPKHHPGMHVTHHPHHPPHGHERSLSLESRNQSFEGGHYHGSFSRADTMSFESRSKGVPDARQGYHQPHYPPHAPSWGSQGSFAPPPPHPYSPPYRMQVHHGHHHGHPGMMRSFSQESGAGLPPNFQPPSEFQAPPTNLNKNRPRTEKHIMTTPFVASKTGVFGWTKEEDMRLTEIMKKHKNPRDWEPIAKELARNRTYVVFGYLFVSFCVSHLI